MLRRPMLKPLRRHRPRLPRPKSRWKKFGDRASVANTLATNGRAMIRTAKVLAASPDAAMTSDVRAAARTAPVTIKIGIVPKVQNSLRRRWSRPTAQSSSRPRPQLPATPRSAIGPGTTDGRDTKVVAVAVDVTIGAIVTVVLVHPRLRPVDLRRPAHPLQQVTSHARAVMIAPISNRAKAIVAAQTRTATPATRAATRAANRRSNVRPLIRIRRSRS